jgi:hypothetical protein
MKTSVIFFFFIVCCLPGICYSQTIDYTYGYDASGNRISRTFIYKRSAIIPKDTLYSANPKTKESAAVNEMIGNTGITIYPNPTRGLLTVNIPLTENDIARVSLYDLQGKLLMDYKNSGTTTEIDLAGLPTGVYLLRIFLNGQPATWKIIKQD